MPAFYGGLLSGAGSASRRGLFKLRLSDYISLVNYVASDTWYVIFMRHPTDDDKMHDLRMRTRWSEQRIDAYFGQFGFPPTAGFRKNVHK